MNPASLRMQASADGLPYTFLSRRSSEPLLPYCVSCQAPMHELPKHWIEYIPDWRTEPMAYWVHVEQGIESWRDAIEFVPPAPKAEGRKGFPVLYVEVAGMVFRFSSRDQLLECIRVPSLKSLPTTTRLSALRGSDVGPNGHWLSRLPGNVKSPKVRAQVVRRLSEVAEKFGA